MSKDDFSDQQLSATYIS